MPPSPRVECHYYQWDELGSLIQRNVHNSMKIFIESNGCPSRGLDVSRLVNYFELNKCKITLNPEKADYILFVTCAALKSLEEDCFKRIELFEKYDGELIVLGCLPEISPRRFNHNFKGKFIATKDLHEIDRFFDDFEIKFKNISDSNTPIYNSRSIRFHKIAEFLEELKNLKDFSDKQLKNIENRKNRFIGNPSIRISNGCMYNCTYCGIRKAIGKLKSKPLETCLNEYRSLLDRDFKHFNIIADNVGAYGLDIGSSLSELFKKMSFLDKNKNVSWSISAFHPVWVVKFKIDLIKYVKENKIISITCPVQSGSSRILSLMKRYSEIEHILTTLLELKSANPNLYLSTHVIIGFPTEKENDLLSTLNLLKKVKFNDVWLYPYNDIEGTIAYSFDNKIDNRTITNRLKILSNSLEKEGIKWFR
jgi:threonylcarbamoyladenosine tRNA methylthiotransferase CDKAL1